MEEQYLHYKKAGDQYLGSIVNGMNSNSFLFAVSPPYFDFEEVEDKPKVT